MPSQTHVSRRPSDYPAGDPRAERQYVARKYLAALEADVAQIDQLEKLEHRLRTFAAVVREWREMAGRYGS